MQGTPHVLDLGYGHYAILPAATISMVPYLFKSTQLAKH
jgi:hypothetical protein